MRRLFDAPAGRCMLHTWGGEGWQFVEVTVFGADGYSVREEMGGGARTEPYAVLIHRLTGLEVPEAEVILAEAAARWRDSGEEAEESRQGRLLLRLFKGSVASGVSIVAAVAGGASWPVDGDALPKWDSRLLVGDRLSCVQGSHLCHVSPMCCRRGPPQ